RKWDYEPLSINTYTTDESLLKIVAKVERVARGEFALSATVDFNYEPDNATMVEASSYCSTSGAESDYKLLPLGIPRQPFYDYLNTYYKDVVVKNLGHCSNLPQFEGQFEPPFPQGTYKINKCKVDGEGLPEIVLPGFYKIIFSKSGPDQPTWGFTAVFKVTNKLF
ncbi:hypothetical protein KR038_008960, partial [Drosophila bunnanda]